MEIFNDFERLNTIVSGVSDTVNVGNTVDVSASISLPVSGSFSTVIAGTVDISAAHPLSTIITNPQTIVGISGTPNIIVSNLPTVQTISGTVSVENQIGTIGISGTPSVSVTNFPDSFGISGTTTTNIANQIAISALPNVTIGNFPTIQSVSGTIQVNTQQVVGISGAPQVSVSFPTTQGISASSVIPVSGSFTSSPTNIQFNGTPVTHVNPLPVSGTFQSSFPSTMGVSAASPLATVVSNSISVSSIPNVTVNNPQTIVGISGTPNISISNFPTTQGVSGTVSVSGSQTVTVSNIVGVSATSFSTIVTNPVTTVGVSSIPNVTINNPQTVVGVSGNPSVSISNFPAAQTVVVSGTHPVTVANVVGISASSLSTTITNPVTTVGISGTPSISVSNFPQTQGISGTTNAIIVNPITTVGVSSIPNVTINNPQMVVGISGTPAVSISNLPSIQVVSATTPLPVSGTFAVAATDIQFNGTPVTSSNPLPITGNLSTTIGGTLAVSAEAPLSTNLTSNSVAYWPAQTFVQPGTDTSYVDPAGNIQVRGAFTSDEGSYSNDFNSSATYDVLIGDCIFTSGSTQVSGIGTQFTKQLVWGDHVRLSTDAELYFSQVLSVESDTLMTIDEYIGTGGTGTGYYFGFHPFVGSGASISVSNSIIRIDSGTTSGANTFIARDIDFQPTACIMRNFYITSNPNEVTPYYGFFDSYDIYTANAGAYVWFSNKELNGGFFITKTSKSVGAQSIIPFILPNGAMITSPARWRIEVTDDSATLIYNDLIIATSRIHLPALYAPLTFLLGAYNETASTTSCQMYLDEILFKNVDVVNTASVLQTHVQNSSDYVTQEYLKELTSIVQLLVPTVRAMTNNVAMMVDINGRQRTNIEAGTVTANCNINATQTLATVTTVATVANQTNNGGYSAADQIPSLINMNGISIRDKIIVS